MNADAIYRELGKSIVVFQWLENRVHQIAWALIDMDHDTDPRGETAGFWFKKLLEFVTEKYVTYIDTHEVHAPEQHKRDFLALMERCRSAADHRNRIVHSTYVHLEGGGELLGILRSKMSSAEDETGVKTLKFDQEPLNEDSFDEAMKEIADLGFQLGMVHVQLTHWHGRPAKKTGADSNL